VLTADDVDVAAALAWAAAVMGPIADVRELAGGWTSTMLSLTTEAREDVVLRLMTREPWRSHGQALTTRESEIQEMLAPTSVPAPRSRALDADGRSCGYPAHLMSLAPGQVDVDRVDATSLTRLADMLATVHDVVPTIEVRTYQSWAWEAKYTVPPWATDRCVWEEAFALLRTDPPTYRPCFIHRDFQLRNVLWHDGQVSGVVDWVETSIGPAWLDVAHCCSNMAMDHGNEVADAFAAAYVDRTDSEPQPYFEAMDIVGFLPPAGKDAFPFEVDAWLRLEERLRSVMQRTVDY
jgi:aminoglycoside phosphotransferase (APT) family kinase protein